MPTQNNNQNKSWLIALVMFNIIFILVICALVTGGGFYISQQSRKDPAQPTQNTSAQTNFSSSSVTEADGNVIDLVAKTQPAVVTVVVKGQPSSTLDSTTQDVTIASGTGFFVSEDGLLITNEHVVCETDPSKLVIVTTSQKSYSVSNIAVDSAQDVAVLKVNTNGDKVQALKFANPNTNIKIGESVIAIGNPLGNNPGSVTKGIISGLNRNIEATGSCKSQTSYKDYEGVIQTDAAINSGNSGGPLLNSSGEVIGVNSATSVDANNISYAVPFTRVLKVLDRYQKNNGVIKTPFIGVQYSMITSDGAKILNLPVGAQVKAITAGSPAEKAEIQKGDIITKIDDKVIEFSLLSTLNLNFEPNQSVKVTVYRPNSTKPGLGDYITLNLVIGEK